MVVAFRLGSDSCLVGSNLCISGSDYSMGREVFGSLRVYFIYVFCTGLFVLV